MTQKELLYVKDAIMHEKNTIGILNETLDLLEDSDLVNFVEKEVKIHSTIFSKLSKLLEDKANEW